MSLKYNFSGIDGAASAVQGTVQSLATYTVDGTQSGDGADINIGVGELQECTISKSNDGVAVDDLIVNAVISGADYAGTKDGLPNVPVVDLQLDQNSDVLAGTALPSVTDIIIDPFNPGAADGAKGGNVEFEWKIEEGESSGDVFDFKAMEVGELDPQGNLYVATDLGVWRSADFEPDIIAADLSFSIDVFGVPATLAEYGLLLA